MPTLQSRDRARLMFSLSELLRPGFASWIPCALVLIAGCDAYAAPVCSRAGENCQATSCCEEAGHQCFVKDSSWAGCKPSCTPGIDTADPAQFRTPWSCEVFKVSMAGANPCSIAGVGCMTTRCCVDPDNRCFQKDQYWADCKPHCEPGIHEEDVAEFRTPWRCSLLDVNASGASQVSLEAVAAPEPARSCSGTWQNCQSTRCCSQEGYTCFEKDDTWADCRLDCKPGINPDDPEPYRTPWKCNVLEPVVFRGSSLETKVLAPVGSPVARHGRLFVKGNQILGAHGRPVRIRGVSLFWSQWGSKFWNQGVIQWLRDDWRVSLIRAAMGVEDGGYLDSPDRHKQIVADVVDAAILAGLYIIIDWHDHAAHLHQEEAASFFAEMARIYGQYPNVIFEPWNEPIDQSWKYVVRPYHEMILGKIRRYSPNLVTCGSPTWCQDVDVASEQPLDDSNVAYALHFYAGTHQSSIRRKAEKALKNGVALFVTEWGLCQAHGDGSLNFTETELWLKLLETYNISDASWAVNDKDESCDALIPGADSDGGWGLEDLTASGQYVRKSLVDMPWDSTIPTKEPLDFDESGCAMMVLSLFHAVVLLALF